MNPLDLLLAAWITPAILLLAAAAWRLRNIRPVNACPDCLAHGSPWCAAHAGGLR